MKVISIGLLSLLFSVNLFGQQTIALVEQFTGFRCLNCPDAMILMDSLENEFQDSVVFVNIHAGTFAYTLGTGPSYMVDLTTPEGEIYLQTFPPIGIPEAMISRRPNPQMTNTLCHLEPQWRDRISDIVSIPKPVDMIISYTYDAMANEFDITVQNELMINHSGDYNIVYYIIEDDVVTDQQMQNGSTNTNYSHQNVLRDVLNSTWGDLLLTGNLNAGTIVPHTIQYTPSTNIWNLNNCSIVAYIRNTSNDEVIQVAKTGIHSIPLATSENELIKMKLYPNPVSNSIFYEFRSEFEIASLTVEDGLGRIILRKNIQNKNKGSLDLSQMKSGTYFIKLKAVNGTFITKKIIKN